LSLSCNGGNFGGMKIKTSLTLTDTLVADIDQICGSGQRSAFVEEAIRAKLGDIARRQRDAKDLAILNKVADEQNAESEDILDWQVSL
jgi:metal-responsive CopG/Arc/MetJ family transcriptional regulator